MIGNEFNYIFELFTLLISLSVAEILAGFSRLLKLRARRKAGVDPAAIKVRMGWLVPLLGLLVLIDLATFWNIIWTGRGVLDMQMATVLGVLVLIGGYYLVATLVFPDEPELWPDFDAYYWLQKRYVVWGIFGINALTQGALFLLGAQGPENQEAVAAAVVANPLIGVASLLLLLNFPAFIWLGLSKRKRVNIALMLYIILTQFLLAITTFGVEAFQ